MFKFNESEKKVTIQIDGAPKMILSIPEKSEWVAMPGVHKDKNIFAFKTSLIIKHKKIEGWVIYERIRWDQKSLKTFGDFKTFYWVPLVINGDFYHFELHDGHGDKTANKWYIENEKIKVESVPDFELNIIETEKDKQSGREHIPKAIQIKVPRWDMDISLDSKGSQIGYGQKFPKGLAYYRQSMLLPKKESKTQGYGMLELILENN